jgi:outer membrane receptor protein involved in Fe transport
MVQRAVRAPNIGELDTTPALSVQRLAPQIDFCAASNDPVGAGLTGVCVAQGMSPNQIGIYDPAFSYNIDVLTGGNPELTPETADTFTAGFTWRSQDPVALQASFDYVRVKLNDAIENFGPGFDFGECALAADPKSAACRVIHRNSDGTVASVDSVPINFARAVVESLDLNLDVQMDAPDWASIAPGAEISLELHASHYLQNASALSPNEPMFDCVGFFACGDYNLQGVVTPSTVATTSIIYSVGTVSALLRWRWIDGVDNVATKAALFYGDPLPVLAIPHIGAMNYVDLALEADIGEQAQLRAGVDNVFEADPPQMAGDQVQANTDPARYDVFGRRFFLAVDYRLGD